MVITTREHGYTHLSPSHQTGLDVRVASYDELLKSRGWARATHIFTDLDRLPSWRLHEAALHYRRLKQCGIKVLNDPAKFLGRFGLLRALNDAGINDFNVYRADDFQKPSKWPVFLRLEGNHAAPVSGLLEDEGELEEALRRAINEGAPRSALLIIEYNAEPVQPGIYRKLSVFRVGDRMLGYTCAHDNHWLVKYGNPNVTTPELYDEEYRLVAEDRYAEALRPAFDLAGIEYGRVDFGLVNGRPQIYEINSNPHVELNPKPSMSSRRNQSIAAFRPKYIDAMNGIDFAPRPAWKVKSSALLRSVGRLPRQAIGKVIEGRTFLRA